MAEDTQKSRLLARLTGEASVGRRSHAKPWQAYLFILPGLLIYILFVLIPIINTFRYSFYKWTGFSEPTFIGLENYIELFGDKDFWTAISHNFFFVIFYTILPILLGLFLTALLTQQKLRGMTLFRTGLFIPYVMSPVVVGIIWRWLFALDGPINGLLNTVGLGDLARPWLGDFTFAPYAAGLVGTWIEYGLCMVIFIAGAQNINQELYDTAVVFGANLRQQFRYVTLPGLRQQIMVAFVITFIAAMRLFDLIFVLTGGGGPGKVTLVTSMFLYNEAFTRNKAGYATSVAVVLTVIILIVSVVVTRLQAREEALEDL
ncbi:MAG TPA: sugar ABC transporter permease [Spirillospora sp.]|nr:sugar ABC transporter permease [Spirillospora sp.]